MLAAVPAAASPLLIARAARAAPTMGVNAVAAAAGVSGRTLVRLLESLAGRGRCVSALVDRFAAMPDYQRVTVAAGPFCAPPLMRAICASHATNLRDWLSGAVDGSASWAARGLDDESFTRRGACGAAYSGSVDGSYEHNVLLQRSALWPSALLARLAQRRLSPLVNHAALKNPACPAYALAAHAGGDRIRAPRSGSVTERLACSADPHLRSAAASHARCSVETLAALAEDADADVRAAAAANPGCPQEALLALAEDRSSTVRGSVASNPSTPLAKIEALSLYPAVVVQKEILQRHDCPTALFSRLAIAGAQSLRITGASNPRCPAAVLVSAAAAARETDSPFTRRWRCAIAANPSSPPSLLAELTGTDEPNDVRVAAVSNTSCPLEAAARLVAGGDTISLRIAAAAALRRARRRGQRTSR